MISSLQFEGKIAAITVSLRDRMRFYKLRVTPNAANVASTFNDQFKPEIIAEHNDPLRVDWIESSDDDVLVAEKAIIGIVFATLTYHAYFYCRLFFSLIHNVWVMPSDGPFVDPVSIPEIILPCRYY